MKKIQSTILRAACAVLAAAAIAPAWATVDIQGVPLDETVQVGGQTLVLNGAGFRKRGYFKVDVTGLYLASRATTIDAVEKAQGAKRLELVIQQDISGAQASRYFLTDFEASAQPMEFAQLINEVSLIGNIYSGIRQVKKGDIITMDWIPGKGMAAALNGTPLVPHGQTVPYINNELLCRVMYRMYIGGKTPAELRDNLLGVSYSMRDKPPTGQPSVAAAAPAPAAQASAAKGK